jgi:hypothetical protein
MAETRRVSAASSHTARPRGGPRPRLPHPPRYNAPLRPPADDTQDLRPPASEPGLPRPVVSAPEKSPESDFRAARPRLERRAVPPPRSRPERVSLGILLLGLALNALAILPAAKLSLSDLLLGGTVLLAGVTLLVLMEVYRRTGP